MQRATLRNLVLLLMVSATPALAGWQEHATPHDVQRLTNLAAARAQGLRQAQGASDADLATVRAVLNRNTQSPDLKSLTGNWRCRSIKLGGMERVKIFGWFTCRIGERDSKPYFEKANGSQHLRGALYLTENGFVFLGGMNAAKDKPADYSGARPSLGAATTPSDVAGLLSLTGPNTARLEFPNPAQESTFDVIELKR